MKHVQGKPYLWTWILVLAFVSFLTGSVSAQNSDVLGEVQFEGKTNVEKTSGVWVDGQYVGYLKELKASKKVLLLPGEHTISVRKNGYRDFTQGVVLQPGQTQIIRVTMDKAATGIMPADPELATIKIDVNPSRAAVFVDGRFVGHVGEFGGLGRAMQVAPGSHQIRIALPGYATFQTDINLLPRQKVEVKTDLVKSDRSRAATERQDEQHAAGFRGARCGKSTALKLQKLISDKGERENRFAAAGRKKRSSESRGFGGWVPNELQAGVESDPFGLQLRSEGAKPCPCRSKHLSTAFPVGQIFSLYAGSSVSRSRLPFASCTKYRNGMPRAVSTTEQATRSKSC